MKAETHVIRTRRYESPCGTLLLGALEDRLCLCDWLAGRHHERVAGRLRRLLHATFAEGPADVTEEAAAQLDEYFAGRRTTFDVPLLTAGTDFQQAVWRELLRIPYGQAVSYADVAQAIGMPKAVRAVANANGANAIAILIPCHRVIGSDHTLTGYAGGLDAKRLLLELEGKRPYDNYGLSL